MKNKLCETDEEFKALKMLRDVYGNDALSFRFTGSEVVEMMAMAIVDVQAQCDRKEKYEGK